MKVSPKKALGQHFLQDKNIAKKIVDAIGIPDGGTVIELGPGTGALTTLLDERLSPSNGRVIAIEIDKRAISYLEGLSLKVTTIMFGDMLQCSFSHLAEEVGTPLTIVSNLPYNISGPMLAKFFDEREDVKRAILMVQKEVGERVMSGPGSKQYGVLSVFVQYAYAVERLFLVPKGAFSPRPKVQSMVIRLTRRVDTPFSPIGDEALFKKVVRCAFQMRRKKIKNAIQPLMSRIKGEINAERLLQSMEISGDRRPEELSIEDFIKISNKLMEYI